MNKRRNYKCVNLKSICVNKHGKNKKSVIEINQAKIDENLKYAGYNLLVTSELDMEPLQIYHIYHNLWKIEESFRITKSYLDARPVYVQKKETIYGHFLICYLSLFLLRIIGNNAFFFYLKRDLFFQTGFRIRFPEFIRKSIYTGF